MVGYSEFVQVQCWLVEWQEVGVFVIVGDQYVGGIQGVVQQCVVVVVGVVFQYYFIFGVEYVQVDVFQWCVIFEVGGMDEQFVFVGVGMQVDVVD